MAMGFIQALAQIKDTSAETGRENMRRAVIALAPLGSELDSLYMAFRKWGYTGSRFSPVISAYALDRLITRVEESDDELVAGLGRMAITMLNDAIHRVIEVAVKLCDESYEKENENTDEDESEEVE